MRNLTVAAAVIAALFILQLSSPAEDHKYIGFKGCKPCHSSEKSGKQADIWSKSKHSEAYNTLTTPKAIEIAKAKGIANPAESKECLECHSIGKTVAADMLTGSFDIKNGVQCESCHGAGSDYKARPVMMDKGKAIEAGLTNFKDEAGIEAVCKNCHNDKSPTFKPFDFKERWEKIKHPKPKS